jgi:hypothetical protein
LFSIDIINLQFKLGTIYKRKQHNRCLKFIFSKQIQLVFL